MKHELLVDEILHGHGDLAPPEERKYRVCKGFDCFKILPLTARSCQVFHSPQCGQRHRRTIINRKTPPLRQCSYCRTTFMPRGIQKYHNANCARLAMNKRSRAWRAKNRKKNRTKDMEYQRHVRASARRRRGLDAPRLCDWCKGEFVHPHPRKRFCTDACRYEDQKASMRERYKSDPEYRARNDRKNAQYRQANPDKFKVYSARYEAKRSAK